VTTLLEQATTKLQTLSAVKCPYYSSKYTYGYALRTSMGARVSTVDIHIVESAAVMLQ